MDTVERAIKVSVLATFCLLNAIDMVQTMAFLKMGIEANLFVVYHPLSWGILKASFTFGLPPILYLADVYLEEKTDANDYESIFPYLRNFVLVAYIILFFADIVFLSIVVRNAHVLGRLLP